MKKICIISNGYPTQKDPSYAFIRPLVMSFSDNGYQCTVIAPQSITKSFFRHKNLRKYRWHDFTEKGNSITVLQPYTFSFSNFKIFGIHISTLLRDLSIRMCYFLEKLNPDILYAHFWDCGIAAAKIAKKKDKVCVVATGESTIRVRDYYCNTTIDELLPYIKGVLCVSSKNLIESKSLGLITEKHNLIVLPNGFDPRHFYKIPKDVARKALSIEYEGKIAIFVGSFDYRKGVDRFLEATKEFGDLKIILVGEGKKIEYKDNILFIGRVPHDKLVYYLCAADFFVLPTLNEGCCNAIIEAMACGLPIVSSDRSFNYDILNDENSILIDPMNISDIRNAVNFLKENDIQTAKMCEASLITSKKMILSKRSERIIRWMEKIYNESQIH